MAYVVYRSGNPRGTPLTRTKKERAKQRVKMQRLKKAGWSDTRIAKLIGCCTNNVVAILRRAEIRKLKEQKHDN